MGIAAYLKEIGRGKEGARSLTREQACDLMRQLLSGAVSDLELGGFALAMRIKGETPQELAGFLDAAAEGTLRLIDPALAADPRHAAPVLLPSYNGARKLPNFTPLLALLLADEGVPVLVHGVRRDGARVTSAEIFTALDLPPVAGAEGLDQRWSRRFPAFVAIDELHPGLARLLALREVLGLRNSAHSLVKLLPALPGSMGAIRVMNHTHPEYAQSMGEFIGLTGADALLLRGTEGEPVADARRRPALRAFLGGALCEELSMPAQEGVLAAMPALPAALDAAATARTIQSMLAGELPIPESITAQVRVIKAMREAVLARDAALAQAAAPSPSTRTVAMGMPA